MKKIIGLTIALGTLAAALVLTGCSGGPAPGNPSLPPGFKDAPLPDLDLNAYAFVAKDTPVQLHEKLLTGEPAAPSTPGALTMPSLDVNVLSLSGVAGTSVDSFGATANLTDQREVALARDLLGRQKELWTLAFGNSISIVKGADAWAQSLKDAYTNNRQTTIETKYPEVWELVRLLPESPPSKPIAAGFVRTEGLDLEALGAKAHVSVGNIKQALNTMKAKDMAFAVYAEDKFTIIPKTVDAAFFKDAKLGTVFVTKSSYPGLIFGLAVNTFGGGAGLEKVTIGDTDARYMKVQDIHLYLVNRGSVLIGAASPGKDYAEKLLLSAIK